MRRALARSIASPDAFACNLLSSSGVSYYEIRFRILAVFPRSIFQDRESAEAETQHTAGIFRFKILLPLSGMLCAGFLFPRRGRSAQKGLAILGRRLVYFKTIREEFSLKKS